MSSLLNRRQRLTIFKLIALLSLVRWYNILTVALAQYLASIFILHPDKSIISVLLDIDLHLVVFSSGFIIASGFIINSFYDLERDSINRPNQVIFNRLVSQQTCLNFYFLFNTLGITMSYFVSKRIMLFNFLFSIALWFYSHKLKKKAFLGNLSAMILTIAPFFGIIVYYDLINYAIFFYVAYIAIIVLIREVIKDLIAEKGDLVFNYQSVSIVYGHKKTKTLIWTLMLFTILPPIFLYYRFELNTVIYYFGFASTIVVYSAVLLQKATTEKEFERINSLYKLILLSGIISIVLV